MLFPCRETLLRALWEAGRARKGALLIANCQISCYRLFRSIVFLHQQQLELKWKLFVKASLFFSQFFSQLWHNIPQRARKPHLRGNFFLIGKTSPAEWSPVRHEALKSHAERKTNELLFPVYIWLTEKMCIYYGSSNHRLLNMSSTTTTTCNIWK